MHAAYFRVPEGMNVPAPIGALPGDWIVLRPSHPDRPLSVIHHIPHGIVPAIMEYIDELEFVEASSTVTRDAAFSLLREAVGQTPDPRHRSFVERRPALTLHR